MGNLPGQKGLLLIIRRERLNRSFHYSHLYHEDVMTIRSTMLSILSTAALQSGSGRFTVSMCERTKHLQSVSARGHQGSRVKRGF